MAVEGLTNRELYYNIIDIINDKERKNAFVKLIEEQLEKTNEIKLPMQLFEMIFNFDFHRGAKHPIATNVMSKFKKRGMRISKVRNKYLVRIKKRKEKE